MYIKYANTTLKANKNTAHVFVTYIQSHALQRCSLQIASLSGILINSAIPGESAASSPVKQPSAYNMGRKHKKGNPFAARKREMREVSNKCIHFFL